MSDQQQFEWMALSSNCSVFMKVQDKQHKKACKHDTNIINYTVDSSGSSKILILYSILPITTVNKIENSFYKTFVERVQKKVAE